MTVTSLEASPYVQVLAEVNRRGLIAATLAALSAELLEELSGLYSGVYVRSRSAAGLDVAELDAVLAAADRHLEDGQQFAGRIESFLSPYAFGSAPDDVLTPAPDGMPSDHRVGDLAARVRGLAHELLTERLPELHDGLLSGDIPVRDTSAAELSLIAAEVGIIAAYLRQSGQHVRQGRELLAALR